MYLQSRIKCEGCLKPVARRLALFQPKDEYECYSESYVKCFWGLCDLHRSNESMITKPDGKVVTKQPMRQELPYLNPRLIKEIFVRN